MDVYNISNWLLTHCLIVTKIQNITTNCIGSVTLTMPVSRPAGLTFYTKIFSRKGEQQIRITHFLALYYASRVEF